MYFSYNTRTEQQFVLYVGLCGCIRHWNRLVSQPHAQVLHGSIREFVWGGGPTIQRCGERGDVRTAILTATRLPEGQENRLYLATQQGCSMGFPPGSRRYREQPVVAGSLLRNRVPGRGLRPVPGWSCSGVQANTATRTQNPLVHQLLLVAMCIHGDV
jgi:hypothetical protein